MGTGIYNKNEIRIFSQNEMSIFNTPVWRIGTRHGGDNRSFWDMMRNNNVIAIGYDKLRDLSVILYQQNQIDLLVQQYYPNVGKSSHIYKFGAGIQEGDIVLAADGWVILGIGKVTGPYEYNPTTDFPHHRHVKWLSLDRWELKNYRGTLQRIRNPEALIIINQRLSQLPPGIY